LKILNLYAGIGGNRKLWEDVEVTAVEYNPEIAAIYQEYFPNDTVIVADAHQYLLDHYKEFDFIWSSPPCQSHSQIRAAAGKHGFYDNVLPDMKLWQEIIFLKKFSICPFVVENVIPYYKPFVEPSLSMERHLFWSFHKLKKVDIEITDRKHTKINSNSIVYGYDLKGKVISTASKEQILRNLVNPEIGLAILDQVRGIKRKSKLKQISILEEL